jgi:hypothetical protein
MCVIYGLCLIVVPLQPGKNPFAVKINNNKSSAVLYPFKKIQKYERRRKVAESFYSFESPFVEVPGA